MLHTLGHNLALFEKESYLVARYNLSPSCSSAFLDSEGRIEMTRKGWTTNEVGLRWLKTKFIPWAKNRLQETYILLIVDGHRSHVLLEFIDFCIKSQIVALCLPSHTTHILQPQDVGIFEPLSQTYKILIKRKYQSETGQLTKRAFFKIILKLKKNPCCKKIFFPLGQLLL